MDLLTDADYKSLRTGVKGWTRKRLAGHGVSWPPVHGWRTRLLREYERTRHAQPARVRFEDYEFLACRIGRAEMEEFAERMARS